MSGYRVHIRVNLRPEVGGAFVDRVAPVIRGTSLKLQNGSPGVIRGTNVPLIELAQLLSRLTELSETPRIADDLTFSGLLDDLWVHVSKV